MKADYYRQELSELLHMVAAKKDHQKESVLTVPASEYTDPQRLARERRLFATVPLIVGHVSQIASPGDFFVHEDLGVSYLIVRRDDGVARAFLNHCQHRGTKLVHKVSGHKAKRFSCPYHAWCYDSRGSLISVPREDLFPGLDKTQKHLRTVHLEEKYGLLWLSQKGGEPPMRRQVFGPTRSQMP